MSSMDSGPAHARRVGKGKEVVNTLNDVWQKQNLLSLDGGGIRGYWTLLVLEKLMKAIADEELRQAEENPNDLDIHLNSFAPETFPSGATQGRLDSWEEDRSKEDHPEPSYKYREPRKFLPCHYFDYICGSSTGALIAIMLGRFRMSVHDCLWEYESMSNKIFGHPRLVSQRNIGFVHWPKYCAETMERAFQEVTARRCERNQRINNVQFPSPPELCKTFVTTYKYERKNNSKGTEKKLYLIRSYDHEEKEEAYFQKQRTATGSSMKPKNKRLNYGPADSLQIWEVARAATAAPLYFKHIKFQRDSIEGNTRIYFSDGGFGKTNNPTQEGIKEIGLLHGKDNVGVVVNVGTSKGPTKGGARDIFKRVHEFADEATNPEIVAEALEEQELYWRFNDEKGINVYLDEWKPSGRLGTKSQPPGSKTLQKIKTSFNNWAQNLSDGSIEACAKELVRRRRIRTEDRGRWKAYSTGAVFTCRYSTCNNARFQNVESLREHLEGFHEIHLKKQLEDAIHRMTKRWQYQAPPMS